MYRIHKSIDIDFTHHISGHAGPCINLHGHTWKFEVGLAAETLSAEGFVVDFKDLKVKVLKPCHGLLDHGLAMGSETFTAIEKELETMGEHLLGSRVPIHGRRDTESLEALELCGAQLLYPGGLKVAVFPFNPTSERLAFWLYQLAAERLNDDRIQVTHARVYETLHPVESVAEYIP